MATATTQAETLASGAAYYAAQQQINAMALRSLANASPEGAAQITATYQYAAVLLAMQAVAAQVAEQGLDAPPSAALDALAFVGVTGAGADLLAYLTQAGTPEELLFMAIEAIRETGNVSHGVAVAARPGLKGHVRYLNPPSCKDCVILAGRWYRWSEGFQRHPNCDCVMVAVGDDVSPGLLVNPDEAWRAGQVSDLTQAEQQALEDGADMASVVNVRREGAGLRVAGRVLTRRTGRGVTLTPEGIYHLVGDDRDKALELLTKAGYLR